MTLEEYIKILPGNKISKVKLLILKTLWNSGEKFPTKWVKSSSLLKLTGQKYFDRRARELKDELGCDIESEHHNGEHCWRLKSNKLSNYMTFPRKTEAFTS